jgi:hypothetical protein
MAIVSIGFRNAIDTITGRVGVMVKGNGIIRRCCLNWYQYWR